MKRKKLNLAEEHAAPDEHDIIARILEDNRAMMLSNGDTTKRAQHPKHHGLVRGKLSVRANIPNNVRVGIFSEAKTYDVLVRFSNGLQQDDTEADAHGMAIKVLGVQGDKLEPDPKHPDSFDIILVDHPVMFAATLAQYRAASEFVHDRAAIARGDAGWLRKKISTIFETVEAGIEGGFGLLGRLKDFVSQRPGSPLTSHYWSQTPYLLGSECAVKYMAQHKQSAGDLPAAEGPDHLAAALTRGLEAGQAHFVLGVHVQDDPVADPIEDATVTWWDDDADPGGIRSMVAVADIELTALDTGTGAESIAFNPWNVGPEYRPLGGINRVRRRVYTELARRRRP